MRQDVLEIPRLGWGPITRILTSSSFLIVLLFLLFHTHVDYFFFVCGQAVVTGVVPSFPPVLSFKFLSRIDRVSAIPLLVDFSWNAANSRSRAFRKSMCAQGKVPTN